jgi:tetratricopeptide (TPR) repeat protein
MRMHDRNRGRRLLALSNLIRGETDDAKLMKLRKEEAALLIELGNPSEARSAAERLLADYPDWPAGHAAAADIACRSGRWTDAEELFARAAELHASGGGTDASERLRTGPLYRLAEARGDYRSCLALCPGPGELAGILAARASRHLGLAAPLPKECSEPLARRLLLLEQAWTGAVSGPLYGEVLEWGASEPEWRWRFIVEGLELHTAAGGDAGDWRQALAETACPVLDPRFGKERNRLALLSGLC